MKVKVLLSDYQSLENDIKDFIKFNPGRIILISQVEDGQDNIITTILYKG
jgi:hypothetical protein